MQKLFAACFVLFLLAGCATVDSLQPGAGGSSMTVKSHTYDEVWTAAVHSVARNLTIVEESKAQGQIRAQSSAGLMPRGEVVGVFITPAGRNAPSYTIEVQSKSKGPLTGPDWRRKIVAGIKAELDKKTISGSVPITESLSPSEEIVALPVPERPAQSSGVKGGEMSAQVERMARQSGCVPTAGATLIAKTTAVETYQVSCQNAQQALFKCEMRQCRRLD